MRIMILGKPYKLEFVKPDFIADNMGTSNRRNQVIYVSTDQGKEQMVDTLLHEVIHVVNLELVLGLSEETVTRLAVGLVSAGYINKGQIYE